MTTILGTAAADIMAPGYTDAKGTQWTYSTAADWTSRLTIWAGEGSDGISDIGDKTVVYGEAGNDWISASTSAEVVSDDLRTEIYGGAGNDYLFGKGSLYINGNEGNDAISWSGVGHAVLSGEEGDDSFSVNMRAETEESVRLFAGEGADHINIRLGSGDVAELFLQETVAAADSISITSLAEGDEGGLVDLGADFDPALDSLEVNGVTYTPENLQALAQDPQALEGVDASFEETAEGSYSYLAFAGNDEGGAVTLRIPADVLRVADPLDETGTETEAPVEIPEETPVTAEESGEDESTDGTPIDGEPVDEAVEDASVDEPVEETVEEAPDAAGPVGNGRVEGTEDADIIKDLYTDADGDSTAEAVRINGFGGDDYIRMKNGISHIIGGGDGNDSLYGVNGEHHLAGEAGDDLVVGGNMTCLLEGGKGNDTLVGYLDHGADHEMHLGKGNDVVDLRDASDTETSNVLVTDFRFGEDVLMFDGEPVDFATLPEGVSGADDEDGNLVLSFNDDDTVTLRGQSMSSLTSYADSLAKDPLVADWQTENSEEDAQAWAELDDPAYEPADAEEGDTEDAALDIPTVPVDELAQEDSAEEEEDYLDA